MVCGSGLDSSSLVKGEVWAVANILDSSILIGGSGWKLAGRLNFLSLCPHPQREAAYPRNG